MALLFGSDFVVEVILIEQVLLDQELSHRVEAVRLQDNHRDGDCCYCDSALVTLNKALGLLDLSLEHFVSSQSIS